MLIFRECLPEFKNSADVRSRLCEGQCEETRAHVLTECPTTKTFREIYYAKIKDISPEKRKELATLPLHRHWVWILGAGTIREEEPDPANNNRINRQHAGINAGKSVTAVKDKNDENECLNARILRVSKHC